MGLVVAARVGDLLGVLEGVAVDEGFVGVGDEYVAVGDVADLGGVVEDPADGVTGPWAAGAVGDAARVQFGGDGAGAESVAGVEPEDLAQDWCFVGVRDELVRAAVDEVSVRAGSAGPFSFA